MGIFCGTLIELVSAQLNVYAMNVRRKLILTSLVLSLSLATFAGTTVPAVPASGTKPASEKEARVHELENRLEEIKAMDLSSKSRAEKRELRKEVRHIEKEMKTMSSGGVYISVGSLIIILLLLIILL